MSSTLSPSAIPSPAAADFDAEFRREVEALTSGAALVERSDVGRLHATGEDAIDLLNRLSTNDLAPLEVGDGAATVLTTNKGRIVDTLRVYRRGDGLAVFTSPGNQAAVIEWLDFFTFSEDVAVADVTDQASTLTLVGPRAEATLAELLDDHASPPPSFGWRRAHASGLTFDVYAGDYLALPSYDLVASPADCGRLRDALSMRGALPVGAEAVETVRIERGCPAFGAELTRDYNPHEANLKRLINVGKGCYIGHEVITRLQTYDKVQKRLVGLRWNTGALQPGDFLTREGKRAGVVTSVSPRADGDTRDGLGYVRRAFAEDGTVAAAEHDSAMDVEIRRLD